MTISSRPTEQRHSYKSTGTGTIPTLVGMTLPPLFEKIQTSLSVILLISFVLRPSCYSNLKVSIGLMLDKVSFMKVTISLDLSTRSFIPLPCFITFILTRRPIPLLTPSLVLFPQHSS